MILNLFSIFDPCTSERLRLNWLRVTISFFFVPINYFIIPSLIIFSFLEIYKKMYYEINVFLKCRFSRIIFSILMYYLLTYNFVGLFPYIFTLSRHLVFTLSFALPFWLAFIFYGWFNFTELIFSHILPLGTPSVLIPFIVIIERIRLIIRPLTLSVRLAANIIAGHLLLCLVGSSGVIVVLIILLMVFLVQLCLYILETGVAFIQAYVFSVLTSLYSRDVEFSKYIYSWLDSNFYYYILLVKYEQAYKPISFS